MEIFKKAKEETAIALVTHDLTLAASFADELLLVDRGRIFAAGSPEEVLTEQNIAEVYGCKAEVLFSSSGPVAVFR
jgi:iron complex transport system ATP-binding protein